MSYSYSFMLPVEGDSVFTVVVLPEKDGKFPSVLHRSPYESHHRGMTDEEVCRLIANDFRSFTENGFAVIFQDCMGTGKSSGDSDAFVFERREGLALQEWVRSSDFYNGEIYLLGASYSGVVHFVTKPFASDIKGGAFDATDCELYNFLYLNGFYRSNLHGDWYIDRYKKNGNINRVHDPLNFLTLPMTEYTKKVFGEKTSAFDEQLLHPRRDDPFWDTVNGGCDMRGALADVNFPVFIATGFQDIFNRGVHDMWLSMSEEVRNKSAFIIHPYHHGGSSEAQPYHFPGAQICELCPDHERKWLSYAAGKGEAPFETGKITYYEPFDNRWHCETTEEYLRADNTYTFTLDEGERTYTYDPKDPAYFNGGLTNNFGGTKFQNAPGLRDDILTFYSDVFENDTHVRGNITARLRVKSSCPDTCFYIRLSIVKEEGDYGLRDSIDQISNFCCDYVPGDEVDMDFTFDVAAFLIKGGEKLRVDISSSAMPLFVPHTNNRGLFTIQETSRVAENTVICDKSYVTVNYK
ncbi:MAG: CocE/NonD family hydrolase [Clostridia bacterium]|nr:CocE/NonD family hydrolase [Clostridia bacterium]